MQKSRKFTALSFVALYYKYENAVAL